MKQALIFICILTVFACSNSKNRAIPKAEKKVSDSLSFAQIEFDTMIHDFGKVKSGEVLIYSFEFVNSGNDDLKILKAEGDCGCIEVKYAETAVKPGQKGMLEVKFNSAGMTGKQLKSIEIESNSKELKQLIIFAEVENDQLQFDSKN